MSTLLNDTSLVACSVSVNQANNPPIPTTPTKANANKPVPNFFFIHYSFPQLTFLIINYCFNCPPNSVTA